MYTKPPTRESAPERPTLLLGSGGSDWKLAENWASSIVPSQTPPPHTVLQRSDVGCPALVNTYGSTPYYIKGVPRQKIMAQMKEQIKTLVKELSNKEIANLSDAEFKTW